MATFVKLCLAGGVVAMFVNITMATHERPRQIKEAVQEMGTHQVLKYWIEAGAITLTCRNTTGRINTGDSYTWETERGRTMREFEADTGNTWQTSVTNNGINLTLQPHSSYKVHRLIFYCVDMSGNVVHVIDLLRLENTELFGDRKETQCPLLEGNLQILSCAGGSRKNVTNCSWEHDNKPIKPVVMGTTTALVLGIDVAPASEGRYTCRCDSGNRRIERYFNVSKPANPEKSPGDSFFCRQIALNTIGEITTERPGASPTTGGPQSEAISSTKEQESTKALVANPEGEFTPFGILHMIFQLAKTFEHLDKVGRVERSVGLKAPQEAEDGVELVGVKSHLESPEERSVLDRASSGDEEVNYLQMEGGTVSVSSDGTQKTYLLIGVVAAVVAIVFMTTLVIVCRKQRPKTDLEANGQVSSGLTAVTSSDMGCHLNDVITSDTWREPNITA